MTKVYNVPLLAMLLAALGALISPNLPLDWRAVPAHLLRVDFFCSCPDGNILRIGKRSSLGTMIVTIDYAFGLGRLLWDSQSDSTHLYSYFVSWFVPSRFPDFLEGVYPAPVFLTSSVQKQAKVSGVAQAVVTTLKVKSAD